MSCITSPRVSNLNLIVRGRFFSNDYENTFHIYFLIGLTILDGGTFWILIRGSRHHREENGRMTCSQEEKRGKRVGSDPRVPRSKKADHPRRSHLRLSAILKISCLHAPLLPTCFNFFLPLKTPTILLQSPPLFNLLLSLISISCFFTDFCFFWVLLIRHGNFGFPAIWFSSAAAQIVEIAILSFFHYSICDSCQLGLPV